MKNLYFLKLIADNANGNGSKWCKSTSTILISYQNYIINAFANKKQVDTIYADLAKVFNSVIHELLIAKLNAVGKNCNLSEWIRNFRDGRVEYVKYGNSISSAVIVTSGLPQYCVNHFLMM